jgi:hypothetical protein
MKSKQNNIQTKSSKFFNNQNNNNENQNKNIFDSIDINKNKINTKRDDKEYIPNDNNFSQILDELETNQNEKDKSLNKLNNGIDLNSHIKENNIENDQLLITEVSPKKDKKKSKSIEKKNKSRNLENNINYLTLKTEKESLEKEINKLNQNKKLYEKESFLNLSLVDENIHKDKLKELQHKTLDSYNDLKKVDYLINNIIRTENNFDKKEKIKIFLNNFEKDKEIAELRAKKYSEESKKIQEKMKKDIDKIIKKRIKEIDEKENEKKKQSVEYLKKLKERDKETRLNIEKGIKEKYKGLNAENYIKNKIKKKEDNYLFNQLINKYNQQEKDYQTIEIDKRRKLMTSIPSDELREFKIKYLKNKFKFEKELEEKNEFFKKNELNNKDFIPKYYSHFHNEISDYDILLRNEGNKKKIIEDYFNAKKNYSEKVLRNQKSIINLHLKKEKEKEKEKKDNILKISEKKIIRKTIYNHKKKRILLKKKEQNKPKKYNWELKLKSYDNLDNLSKSYYIEKPIKIPLSYSIQKRKENLMNVKLINYLDEFKKQREEKKKDPLLEEKRKSKNWDKIINNPVGYLYDNINHIKLKAQSLSNDAERNKKILEKKGGILKSPKLGKKVANLLIDSIEAKISILNCLECN